MQIQKTGYQQNFCSATVIATRDKKLVQFIMSNFAKSPSSRGVIKDLSQKGDGLVRLLIADGAEKASLTRSRGYFYDEAVKKILENPKTKHFELSSLRDFALWIATLPILEPVRMCLRVNRTISKKLAGFVTS